MYVSLYRRYRPQKFNQLVGQKTVTNILQNALSHETLGHAYLFSGPRGCGKTTVARLVAKALNCENSDNGEPCCECESCRSVVAGKHLDVIEIDGASNRGIEEIRELKSHVNLAPFMGKKKIYIIDEAHMLTDAASNALLKTLEEPPLSVVFILATTEAHKVPVTIRSRCQHIPFHRIGLDEMVSYLKHIATLENVAVEERALWELGRYADGGLRDALSLMEQALSMEHRAVTTQSVEALIGGIGRRGLEEWVRLLRTDSGAAIAWLERLLSYNVSAERFLETLFPLFRDLWIVCLWGIQGVRNSMLSREEIDWLEKETVYWEPNILRTYCQDLVRMMPKVKYGVRAEVFSGMLQLLFINVGTSNVSVPQPAPLTVLSEPNETSVKTVEKSEPPAMYNPFTAVPSVPHVKKNEEKQKNEILEENTLPAGMPEFYNYFWNNDLSLCAALLHAKITIKENEWKLSRDGMTENELSILSSGRSGVILAEAVAANWGLSPLSDSVQETNDFAGITPPPIVGGDNPSNGAHRMEMQVNNHSIEQLAAYLEAEVLWVRPNTDLDSIDTFDNEIDRLEREGESE